METIRFERHVQQLINRAIDRDQAQAELALATIDRVVDDLEHASTAGTPATDLNMPGEWQGVASAEKQSAPTLATASM